MLAESFCSPGKATQKKRPIPIASHHLPCHHPLSLNPSLINASLLTHGSDRQGMQSFLMCRSTKKFGTRITGEDFCGELSMSR